MKRIAFFLVLIAKSVLVLGQIEVKLDSSITKFYDGIKVGLKNHVTNEVLLDAEYNGIYRFYKNYYEIYNGKRGLYCVENKEIVIPLIYDEIELEKINVSPKIEYMIILKKDNKYTFLDSDLKNIFNKDFDEYYLTDNCIFLTAENHESAYFFHCDCFKISNYLNITSVIYHRGIIATNDNNTVDYYNGRGDLLFKNLRSAKEFNNCFSERTGQRVLLENQDYFIGLYNNADSKFLIPQQYQKIYETYYNLYLVKRNNKYGIINEQNEIVADLKYDSIAHPRPHIRVIQGNDEITKFRIDSFERARTLMVASKNGKIGLINLSGKKVVDFRYDEGEHLNYFYKLKKGNKYLIFNARGIQITERAFDDIGIFLNRDTSMIAAVFEKGKIGYINHRGDLIEQFVRESKAIGYKDLNALYKHFVVALKAEEDSVLYNFCRKLVPDDYSIEFAKRVNFQYRGFPEFEEGYDIKIIVEQAYSQFLDFKNTLKIRNHLRDLEFLPLESASICFRNFKPYSAQVTESPGILKSGNVTYKYTLGELINIDGFWKSITKPGELGM